MESFSPRGTSLALPAIILGVCVIVSTIVVSGVIYRVKALSNAITVTGSSEKIISSDVAKWTSSFSRTVDTAGLKGGYSSMTSDLTSIMELFHARGITDAEISTHPVSINQQTDCVNFSPDRGCLQTRVSYTLAQDLIVEAHDVGKVTKLAQEAAAALIEKGIVFQSQQPEFYYSKLADLKLDMLTEATASAKARAEKIVGSTGASLGHLQSAGMGVFQITPVNSTEISDYGTYDTTSVQKKVTAIVRASFTLE